MSKLFNVYLVVLFLLVLCLSALPVQASTLPLTPVGSHLQQVGVHDLNWNTFMGGTGDDDGYTMLLDSAGNICNAGWCTASWGTPVKAYTGGYDGSVFKLNSNGILQWNTFLGGSGTDQIYGIAADTAGNLYVTGISSASWGSPRRAYASGYDAFIAKLDSNGVLQWNTFLGAAATDYGRSIVLDSAGNVYVTGWSIYSWGTPVRAHDPGAINDAFVARLDNNGYMQWNTFLGGSSDDVGYGIALNNAGNIYVTGDSTGTWGSPVRAYTAGDDILLARLDNNGALIWNTFLGGSTNDRSRAISVDRYSNVYIAGYDYGAWGTPVRAYTADLDVVVARVDGGSGALQWNTFLGGTGSDRGDGMALDSSGNVYIAGNSNAAWGMPLRAFTAAKDVIVCKLGSNGVLDWHSFLGGASDDWGYDVAVDPDWNIFVTGGSKSSWGLPVRAYTAGNDAFVFKLAGDRVVQTYFNTVLGTINMNTDAGSISNAGCQATADIRCSTPAGYIFPYGMLYFNIDRLTAGQTARVTLQFSNPLPLGTKYYKCINGRIMDCTSLVTRINEYTLQLALTDGGLGDADDVANGTIVDPGGPAFPLNVPQSSSAQMPVAPQKPVSLSNISVKNASLSATKVTPGTPVIVTAGVVNTGTGNGTSVIKVYVNGLEVNSQGVSVNSGSASQISFSICSNEPGTYSVYVDGTNAGSFTVDQYTSETILYISGALVFFALVLGVIYLTRRRV